jgi:rhodanese-related sulfurtransferase
MKKLLFVLVAALIANGAYAQAQATPASETILEIIQEASQEAWMQISPEDAANYLFEVEPVLVDVRTADEFANGYIEGAVNFPVTELDQYLGDMPADLDTPIVVYCAIGGRGFWALTYVTSLGYTNVKNISGGFNAWVDAGFPTAP